MSSAIGDGLKCPGVGPNLLCLRCVFLIKDMLREKMKNNTFIFQGKTYENINERAFAPKKSEVFCKLVNHLLREDSVHALVRCVMNW